MQTPFRHKSVRQAARPSFRPNHRSALSPKAPGALLKLGYSQDGLKQRAAAEATLRDVIQKYPTSDEAGQAQSHSMTNRLRKSRRSSHGSIGSNSPISEKAIEWVKER